MAKNGKAWSEGLISYKIGERFVNQRPNINLCQKIYGRIIRKLEKSSVHPTISQEVIGYWPKNKSAI